LNDSLSTDIAVKGLERVTDHRARLSTWIEKVEQTGMSDLPVSKLADDLAALKPVLSNYSVAQVYLDTLSDACRHAARRPDKRNTEVLCFGLKEFSSYLQELQQQGRDSVISALPVINELLAMMGRDLASQSIFSVPELARVNVQSLQSFNKDFRNTERYLEFSVVKPELPS